MAPENSLNIETEVVDGAVIVRPHGDVDLASSPELRAAMHEAVAKEEPKTIIDLCDVSYMDSSGVATLVEALQNTRRAGGALILCGMNDRVRSIFQIARLDAIFTIMTDLAEASGSGD